MATLAFCYIDNWYLIRIYFLLKVTYLFWLALIKLKLHEPNNKIHAKNAQGLYSSSQIGYED